MFNYKLKITKDKEEITFDNDEIFSINYYFKPVDTMLGNIKSVLNIDVIIEFINDPNDGDVRKNSKLKFNNILNWILESEKNDTRKVVIENVLSNEDVMNIEFNEINIYELSQSFETNNPGRYEIKLKQNYFVEKSKIILEGRHNEDNI